MRAGADVFGLFSINVVSFSRNVVLTGALFSANVGRKWAMFLGQAIYVLGPLHLVGAFTSFVTTYANQRAQYRRDFLSKQFAQREALYSEFINEAARLQVDSLEQETVKPGTLAVIQRTRELGIRISLGATSLAVLKLVLRDGLQIVSIGLLAGVLAAQGVASLIQR